MPHLHQIFYFATMYHSPVMNLSADVTAEHEAASSPWKAALAAPGIVAFKPLLMA